MNSCCQEASSHQEPESDLMDHKSQSSPLTRLTNTSSKREFPLSELPTRNSPPKKSKLISKRKLLTMSSKREKEDDSCMYTLFNFFNLFNFILLNLAIIKTKRKKLAKIVWFK
jgi:hypothetical protein